MTVVAVRGRYTDPLGAPFSGHVKFTARPAVVYDTATRDFILGQSRTVALDEMGAFEVELRATDDPELQPTEWTYAVREWVGDEWVRPVFDIDVPAAAEDDGIELGDVAPISASQGAASAYVTLVEFNALEARVDDTETDLATLTTDLAAEVTARAAADTAEASTRAAADTAEATARTAAVAAEATARADADALLVPLASVGAFSGVAPLDAEAKVPVANLPATVISDTFVVASQAAMLALDAQRGDVAIRTDLTKTLILATDSPGTLADWKEVLFPTDAVSSVDGRTGPVTLSDLYDAFGAAAAAQAASQPLDADLTAIAAVAGQTAYGRAFLALVNAAAARTYLALGTAATAATGDFDAAGAAAAAQAAAIASAAADATTKANAALAASQPVDADLTAIAALSTAAFGRSLLQSANAAAARTAIGAFAPQSTLVTATGAGTYTIPAGATMVRFHGVGSGGPGGAGRRGAAGTVRSGGAGGGGGARVEVEITVAELLTLYPTGVVPIQVGAPVAPPAGVTINDTNGGVATSTTVTTGATWVGTNGVVMMARGGNPGGGGTSGGATGGSGGFGGYQGGAGGNASATGGVGTSSGQGASGTQGGSSGGGITAADVASNGVFGFGPATGANTGGGAAGVVGGAAPTSGTVMGVSTTPQGAPGGGAASTTGAAQAGADALAGSGNGGAGGGASLNGFTSGAGGAAAAGWLRITAF